jgi:sodium-dependent dicarboxylate transporter 2/3/5
VHDEGRGPSKLALVGLGTAVAVGAYFASAGLEMGSAEAEWRARAAFAVTALVAFCWLTNAMPLGAASLLPLALFPALRVQPMAEVARAYAEPILWMFFGGFVLAKAIERWNLHRRIALAVIARAGMRPRRLVGGFLFAALLISMWISNTASALMLLPIGTALIARLRQQPDFERSMGARLPACIMLAIAYGSSIGGIATPIGTPTNLVFFGNYARTLVPAGAPPLSFLHWVIAFVPLALLVGACTWLLLVYVAHPVPAGTTAGAEALRDERRSLGRMTTAEKRVLMLFCFVVLAWITRADFVLGAGVTIPGWASLLGLPAEYVTDGTVAVAGAVLAFLIPSAGWRSPPLMDWESAQRIPFDLLYLLGAGQAIAGAFQATGLCDVLGRLIAPLFGTLPAWLAITALIYYMIALSELTSNTAQASLMLPLLVAAAGHAGIDPRALMIPATIAASFGFMLPIATPPNAAAFASGQLRASQMARAGAFVNVAAGLLLACAVWLWVFPLLGIDPSRPPPWR